MPDCPKVSVYGAGQLGTAVAGLIRQRGDVSVAGPHGRAHRHIALRGGADLVVIATTTLLADVLQDVEEAVNAGSNVIVSAEEAAFPFIVDEQAARRIDALARLRGVTVLGAGVNPGLIFDALVLTLLGPTEVGAEIAVRRVVDISGFGPAVLRRIGVGLAPDEFSAAVDSGRILGHAGFPQSMHIVASALGLSIDRIERRLVPLALGIEVTTPAGVSVPPGHSTGVDQHYVAVVKGRDWFAAHFTGHIAPAAAGLVVCDEIDFLVGGQIVQSVRLSPGIGAQAGSRAMLANSVHRVLMAAPGWLTVADLPPAFPQGVHECETISGEGTGGLHL
jgi:2,4-diaminopentanoate dehydrogenase